MQRFDVDVRKPARRQIRKLSPPVARRILEALNTLADDPHPRGDTVVRLKGHQNLYRLRVGDWRVVYELAGRTVSVLEVAKREEIYRRGGF